MREDDETKMELHQRIDDLRERLWNICDERKEQAEGERETVMNDGWLDDRLGVLSNFYITMMQAELDRFQDTVRMMKDYYRGMEGEIPEELNVNYARLPLVDVSSKFTLNAPIATKVFCFSRLLKCLRSLYGKQCGPRSECSYRSSLFSGSMLFASILNLSVILGHYLQQKTQQTTFSDAFFLGVLGVKIRS